MSTDPVVESINYQKHLTPRNSEALFILEFKNSDSLVLPLGSVFSAQILINYELTEVLKVEAMQKLGRCEPQLYIANAMTLSIDNRYIPPEYKQRIMNLKDIASVRINLVTFDEEGKRYTRPDTYAYFPDLYFNEKENLYEIIDNTSEDLMFIYVAPQKTYSELLKEHQTKLL